MSDAVILKWLRKEMLRVSSIGRDGNLQSCFSSLEILWVLYNDILKMDRQDAFVLSKGQSNLALMVVLAEMGLIGREELEGFCQFDSRISMQADRTKFNGLVSYSAGSLGHGFPVAVGMAWAAKIQHNEKHIYVLAGDGEMNEGTMWEAALFAASSKLNNLTLIIDDNESISRMLDMGDLREKLSAFGFVAESVDGHDLNALKATISRCADAPIAIIAKTKRGYGCKSLMEDNSWFHRYPRPEELTRLYEEVEAF